MGGPTFKQTMFDWKMPDKYHRLCNFKIDIKNIFHTNNYNIQESEKVPIMINWLCHEGLRLEQTLNVKEQV